MRGSYRVEYKTTDFTTEKMDKLTDVFEKMDKQTLQGRVVIDLSG